MNTNRFEKQIILKEGILITISFHFRVFFNTPTSNDPTPRSTDPPLLMYCSAPCSPGPHRSVARVPGHRSTVGHRSPHTGCRYCMPCPEGINIMFLVTMDSIIKRMPPENVIGWLSEDVRIADNCTDCGQCEAKCPYNLPIRQRIREGVELFNDLKT